MVDVISVAKYLLEKDPRMSHKKLQKLLYYVQAWFLAGFKRRLINCSFEAWVHGPVCRDLYREYRLNNGDLSSVPADSLDPDFREFVDVIYSIYCNFTGDELETLTHSEAPWKESREGLHYWESSNNIISDDSMIHYYENELKRPGNSN